MVLWLTYIPTNFSFVSSEIPLPHFFANDSAESGFSMACTMEFLTSIVMSAQRSLPCFLRTTLPPRGRVDPFSHSTRPQVEDEVDTLVFPCELTVYDQAMGGPA